MSLNSRRVGNLRVSDSGEEGTVSSIHSTVQRPIADMVIGQLEEAESSSKLPPKLLAWGCYPTKLRPNIYSKAHVIGTIASCLQGSKDMDVIMRAQFGRLFELHVARCHNSAKLINIFLCRQLLAVSKYELWFHFATHPLCFSLDEFHQVVGLNCGAFDAVDSEAEDDLMCRSPQISTWNQLTVQCTGPSRMRPKMSFGWNHGRMTDLTVLEPAFPTTAAYGFPLALQLFAFEAVPLLLAKIPNAQSTDNFLVNPPACENTVTILSVNDIVEVEEDPYVNRSINAYSGS
ncbi:hypothetical protein F2Q68_00004187 [Brassica cretica]|uniref:DUF1985 domain-containing protein n=1 Tax=Brassica cretica TaxID=69181 RepID=A0A8S9J621_BRACR|nr:hypothetical protein F2Q68_00004187 [Brassica cretica]